MPDVIITDAERQQFVLVELNHRIIVLDYLKQRHVLEQPKLPRGTVIKVNRKLRQLRNLQRLARRGAVDWRDLLSII
jgi:hypothetical protein